MKISRLLITVALAANLLTTVALAAPTDSKSPTPNATEQKESADRKDKCTSPECHKSNKEMHKDPIKALEKKKDKVSKLEKEGKISKEEADKKIREIDARIKGIEEFNKLPVEQKRAKLIEKFKEHMDLKVKDGKLSKEKADELISDYTKKIQEWDGNGFPHHFHKGHLKNEHKHK
jgi:Spy/CpxP family protein refolding chaperone